MILHWDTVHVGGLGLGYFALRAAAKSKVEVYEINEDCITLFKELHGSRPEMENIELMHDDVRAVRGPIDFLFNDVYQTLLPDELLDDITALAPRCNEYRYWGQELVALMSHRHGYFWTEHAAELMQAGIYTAEDSEFLTAWHDTEGAQLRLVVEDGDYADKALQLHLEAA